MWYQEPKSWISIMMKNRVKDPGGNQDSTLKKRNQIWVRPSRKNRILIQPWKKTGSDPRDKTGTWSDLRNKHGSYNKLDPVVKNKTDPALEKQPGFLSDLISTFQVQLFKFFFWYKSQYYWYIIGIDQGKAEWGIRVDPDATFKKNRIRIRPDSSILLTNRQTVLQTLFIFPH